MNNQQQPIVNMDMLLQMIFQMNSNIQGNANVVTQQLAKIIERLSRIEKMFKAGTQQEQEYFCSASPSPPPLLIVIDQAVIVPTPFDQSQRAPSGMYVPPTVQLFIVEEARLTKRASLYQAPTPSDHQQCHPKACNTRKARYYQVFYQ
ncbi:hypothetical protein INT45_005136 [Circinella minor]|uniref:Uncharacterized protein n=1 Tax=Circinella minor TaxID=1195481 RepID=A0A8H7RDB0_9FUNG|nr:hypothetical protein INT45_005136 [Circinella minor]